MFSLRNWATPLTIGSFIISALSGIIIFFHINIGLVRPAHEWLSWFMILGVGLHMVLNWRSFKGYFKKPVPLAVIGVFVVLTIASLLPLNSGGGEGGNPRATSMKLMRLMESAPVSLVAEMAGTRPDALLEQLRAKGIQVDNTGQTVSDIAENNRQNPIQLLSVMLP
ncbi:MAG: DUF4405 domain-containing protein [Thiothrix sp.]|nr:DUF4405 domain-containing protein [Thiothrix sp.]HPE60276.1 DUF4405 domain-containing protein [Thiolinea sp.]